jgi:hypothetical protein
MGLHERASATLERRGGTHGAETGTAPEWTEGVLSLRTQQQWFQAVVTTPETESPPVDASSAGRLVTASATASSLERLDIYRRSYHARLIECLADDYPVLQQALGERDFETLCRAYIARHPSMGPNLNVFGRHMPEFCGSQALPEPMFAAALAALEWAIVTTIHAPTAPPLTAEGLARVPSERWPEARLSPNPSLRLLSLDYPVNAYLTASRRGAAPPRPDPAKSIIAVYRTERTVWRLELTEPMARLVESLARGDTLGTALSGVAAVLEGTTEKEAARMVTSWFRHAVASGLFAAVTTE